jgi:hypothetical protein
VISKRKKSVRRVVLDRRPNLSEVRQAVDDLFALRQKMLKRRGFKPLSSKETREAINAGRP